MSVPVAPAAGEPRAARGWPRLLHVAVTLLLCAVAWAWLVRHADLRTLAAEAARLPAWNWAAAGAALLAGHALRARRLQREWRHAGAVDAWQCLRIVLAHNAMVLMLPLRAGEGAYLVAVRRQWGVGWAAAARALLRWRLQDASILAVLAAALLPPLPGTWRLALALACGALLYRLLPIAWRRFGRDAAVARDLWGGTGVSSANWLFKLLANGGLLAALAGLSLDTAWRAALGGELAGVQPFQPPAGLGTYEAGVWLAAGLPHAFAPRMVAAALAVHAFSLAVALGAAALAQLAIARPATREEPQP